MKNNYYQRAGPIPHLATLVSIYTLYKQCIEAKEGDNNHEDNAVANDRSNQPREKEADHTCGIQCIDI